MTVSSAADELLALYHLCRFEEVSQGASTLFCSSGNDDSFFPLGSLASQKPSSKKCSFCTDSACEQVAHVPGEMLSMSILGSPQKENWTFPSSVFSLLPNWTHECQRPDFWSCCLWTWSIWLRISKLGGKILQVEKLRLKKPKVVTTEGHATIQWPGQAQTQASCHPGSRVRLAMDSLRGQSSLSGWAIGHLCCPSGISASTALLSASKNGAWK